eukprot:1258175-Rhodomonas_salina.2
MSSSDDNPHPHHPDDDDDDDDDADRMLSMMMIGCCVGRRRWTRRQARQAPSARALRAASPAPTARYHDILRPKLKSTATNRINGTQCTEPTVG